MELFQDSLELPRIASRLLEFPEKPEGSHKILAENQSPTKIHQRKTSLADVSKPSTITELLQQFREQPKPKSSLKSSEKIKKQKTVSFCSQIELSSPDTVMDSVVFTGTKQIFEDSLEIEPDKSTLATATNSILQDTSNSRLERNSDSSSTAPQLGEAQRDLFNARTQFQYEEEVRVSLGIRESEFNEYSTVAYCNRCEKEIVTEVSFEKVKGQGCLDITEWIVCWVLPVCMYPKKLLIHKCSLCKDEIFKAEF